MLVLPFTRLPEYGLLLKVNVTLPVAFSFNITSNVTVPGMLEESKLIEVSAFETVNIAKSLSAVKSSLP